MVWASIVKLCLQLLFTGVTYMRENQLLDAGQDREIAAQTLKVLKLTNEGKRIMEKIDAMDEKDIDSLLLSMERSVGGGREG